MAHPCKRSSLATTVSAVGVPIFFSQRAPVSGLPTSFRTRDLKEKDATGKKENERRRRRRRRERPLRGSCVNWGGRSCVSFGCWEEEREMLVNGDKKEGEKRAKTQIQQAGLRASSLLFTQQTKGHILYICTRITTDSTFDQRNNYRARK